MTGGAGVPRRGEFVTPTGLGGGPSLVWGWLIEQAFHAGINWASGSALSNVLLVFMLIVIAVYARAMTSEEAYA